MPCPSQVSEEAPSLQSQRAATVVVWNAGRNGSALFLPLCCPLPRSAIGDGHWTQAIFKEPGQVSQADVMRTC